jgi:hypothetical protein
MEFLKSSVINDVTPAADGILTYDLPVLPISHLILTIKALNATDEATIQELLALVTKIEVSHLGKDIFNMSAVDAFALNVHYLNKMPFALNPIATDNATRSISLIIPFGHSLYNPASCFKAVNRGELQLALTVDIATSACDGLILQCDAVQIPEASPSNFLKCVTSNFTPAATGEDKVALPLGTIMAGCLIWATTVPATTAWTATIEQLELLVDETEHYFSSSYWESLIGASSERSFNLQYANVNTAVTVLQNHIFLDFDPDKKGTYHLNTEGKQSCDLNINFGDTNAIRVIPVQLRKF